MENFDKLDLFADLIEPAGAIIADKEWAQKWQDGDRAGAIKAAIKGHKREIVEILARIDGVEPEEYQIAGLALVLVGVSRLKPGKAKAPGQPLAKDATA